jgi:hypothetical protein
MQTLLGFWCIERRSSLIGTYVQTFADNGFGDLVASPCPVYSIETANR